MLSLDHFVVGNNLKKSEFLSLCMDLESMDKVDFLESIYFMDEQEFEENRTKGAWSPQRRERNQWIIIPNGFQIAPSGRMLLTKVMTLTVPKALGQFCWCRTKTDSKSGHRVSCAFWIKWQLFRLISDESSIWSQKTMRSRLGLRRRSIKRRGKRTNRLVWTPRTWWSSAWN